MSRRALIVAVALAVTASGCVSAKRFRYVEDQPGCFVPPPDPVPGAPGEKRPFPSVDCRNTLYKIGFIEFNEDGGYVDPAQEQKVLALIDSEKKRAPEGKIITFVYVHGWKNNGDQSAPGAKPKDVERFSTALSELGYRAREANRANPVPVVGVYIGWRGKTLKGPSFFTFISYWSRRNTANRVGGGRTLTGVLNNVIERTNAGSDRSRVMLVGHSFGARVLEHAIEQGVKLYDEETVARQTIVRPRVDLVLYVNSANDARLSMGRVQALQKDPITVRHPDYDPADCPADKAQDPVCKAYPLLVAVTSKGDSATKYLLPVATTLAPDGKSAPTPPKPDGTFADRTPSPAIYRRAAAAHMPFMQSHVVTELTCPADPGERVVCDPTDAACAFAFRARGDCEACFKSSVRGLVGANPPFNRTAFWIMNVDKRISKDHGDIWNLSMLNLIGELMAPRGFFEAGKKQMQIRKAAQ
jgi:hypothetical protein